jgi:D-arginine dehydrogenase
VIGHDNADLAVVGGGVIGAWVAYAAVRSHPHWRVTLFERAAVGAPGPRPVAMGAGATDWSAGVSFPLAATAAHVSLVRDSAAWYASVRGSVAGGHVRELQMVYVTADAAALAARVVDVALRPVTGGERTRIGELLPGLRLAPGEDMLTHDGHGFAVRARPFVDALVASCGDALRVVGGVRVDAVDIGVSGWRLHAAGESWMAEHVVLACGPWSLPALRPALLADPPGTRRKRIAALHATLPVRADDPLVSFVDDDVFILPLRPSQTLVSFYREEWDTDPDCIDGTPSAADLAAGTTALARRSSVAAAAVTGGRAFCDLYTPHRLPHVISHPDARGLVAIRGGSGSGVRLAPALAARAIAAVVDAASPLTPAEGIV